MEWLTRPIIKAAARVAYRGIELNLGGQIPLD